MFAQNVKTADLLIGFGFFAAAAAAGTGGCFVVTGTFFRGGSGGRRGR